MNKSAAGADPRCVNHPERAATATCDGCRSPLCASCTFVFQGRQVCQRCSEILRSGGTVAAPAVSEPAPVLASPSPRGAIPAPPTPQPTPRSPADPFGLEPGRLLAGFALGVLFGLIGAGIWALVVGSTHRESGLLAMAIGWAVGLGVLIGCKEGGTFPAVIGGVVAFAAMMLGFRLTVWPPAGLDWLFIGIGVYGGVRLPLRGE